MCFGYFAAEVSRVHTESGVTPLDLLLFLRSDDDDDEVSPISSEHDCCMFLSEYFFVFTEYHNGLRFLFYETNIKKMKRVYDQNKNKYLLMESP